MRILEIVYEFPPIGGGGGRVVENICKALSLRNHDIHVITSRFKNTPRFEKKDGYEIYRFFTFRRKPDTCSIPEMAAFLFFSFIPTIIHVHKWKPAIIHAHFAVPTGVNAFLIHFLERVPYVLTIHLGDVPGGVPDQTDLPFRFIKPFTFPIWYHAKRITAVSEFIKQLALRAYKVNIITIPNGVFFDECNPDPPIPHQPIRLVFAGRFNPQKNLLFLIDLLEKVKDLSWEMDFFGDGPLLQSVQLQVNDKQLQDRCHFHGWVQSNVISNAMDRADILLLPSLSEGMSVVCVQALSHGLAILGSEIGGITDVVVNGVNGFLCPLNNHSSFVNSLRKLLSDKKLLTEFKSASRIIAKKFDMNSIALEYEKVFNEALE